ncbi:hypothetical protein T4E_10690 [Trichinella pseudospiralis]|uniref:Uncharacterized protein n=1 Tax=Trichinella pseudospiralis TaxID=6337 RepID=A0A0V1G223_TRIPS|nr:hypothetical protein T4E_10690 [Trichinella pseudospiralis]KRY92362.1 hypothetical protein T4D_9052 [Trichinella pseudospiralis]
MSDLLVMINSKDASSACPHLKFQDFSSSVKLQKLQKSLLCNTVTVVPCTSEKGHAILGEVLCKLLRHL